MTTLTQPHGNAQVPGEPDPCPGRLGPLCCRENRDHDFGCVFESTSGVPDKHTATSGE